MTPQVDHFVNSPYGFNVFRSPRETGKTTALLRRAVFLGSDDNMFIAHSQDAARQAKQRATRIFPGLSASILFLGPSARAVRGRRCDGSILWDEADLVADPCELWSSLAPMCVQGGAGMDITLTAGATSCWSGSDISSLCSYLELLGVIAHCSDGREARQEAREEASIH